MDKGNRITSIDALRAFALFGILCVHTVALFGFYTKSFDSSYFSSFGSTLQRGISFLLSNRCNKIFGMLFGVSFYLMLRNPENTSGKFVWRCFLLMLIGVFNKIFYTYDALMWYGLWGMTLVLFRNVPVKKLWVLFFVIWIADMVFSSTVHWKQMFLSEYTPTARYDGAEGLGDIVFYPMFRTLCEYLKAVGSPFGVLRNFLLGYCLAKSGVIENLKRYVSWRNFIFFTIPYVVLVAIALLFKVPYVKNIGYLCGSFSYALLFLLVYYKSYPALTFLEPYGKLGLTNYSCQSIFGVIMACLVFIPYRMSFEYVLLASIIFYCVQLAFSIVWLKHHKYGPFEWVWRCCTNLKFFRNRL